jgi:hypothetical protein
LNIRTSLEGLERKLFHFFRQPTRFRNSNVFYYGTENIRRCKLPQCILLDPKYEITFRRNFNIYINRSVTKSIVLHKQV